MQIEADLRWPVGDSKRPHGQNCLLARAYGGAASGLNDTPDHITDQAVVRHFTNRSRRYPGAIL